MGFQAHATNFVVLPAIAGILLLLDALESGRRWLCLLSGLLCGLAVLMKQHGIFFVCFGLFYLVASEWKSRGLGEILRASSSFTAGVVLPYLITCWLMYRACVFHEFWFWTFSYAGEYSKMGLRRGLEAFQENFTNVTEPAVPLWILAALGLTAPLWNCLARRHLRFLVGFFMFSFLAICPGVYFREHYFVLLLPVIAILISVGIVSASERLAALRKPYLVAIPVLVFLVCFAFSTFQQREFYFRMSAEDAMESTYDESPFLAAVHVAAYVRENSAPTARIAVLGSEPEIYFYAHRHSATGYIYMYSLIERQKYTARMQQQMIREIDANRPDYLVYVDYWDSWGERKSASHAAAFLAWLQECMQTRYERVGVADGLDDTNYVWGDAAKQYAPHSEKVIYVLRRKA